MADEKSEMIKREMYRTSLDSIRVYNPTDKDYAVIWDKFKHIIPAKDKDTGYGKGQKVVPRYIANKYVREMKNKMIYESADVRVQELISRATEDMKIKYQSDAFERQKLYEMTPSISDPKEIERIYDILWLGIEEKFGIDDAEDEIPNDGKIDTRPIEDQILERMERPAKKREEPVDTKYPISSKKKLVSEVSA